MGLQGSSAQTLQKFPHSEASGLKRCKGSRVLRLQGPRHQGSQGRIFAVSLAQEIIPGLQGNVPIQEFQVPGCAGGVQGSKVPTCKGSKGSRAGSRL